MPRPLMQQGIGQLEAMFAKGKADVKLLKQLEHELHYRHVPRAIALLTEVQAAINGGDAASPPARPTATVSKHPDLREGSATPPVAPTPEQVRMVAPALSPLESNLIAPPPNMPLEEAYRALKATPGATWDSIEQARRTLVNQSHPSRLKALSAERRAQGLAEAKRVNAAYVELSKTRCGGK